MTCPDVYGSKTVTLNLFQGPFVLSSSCVSARSMLERQSPEVKQVQHDVCGCDGGVV